MVVERTRYLCMNRNNKNLEKNIDGILIGKIDALNRWQGNLWNLEGTFQIMEDSLEKLEKGTGNKKVLKNEVLKNFVLLVLLKGLLKTIIIVGFVTIIITI